MSKRKAIPKKVRQSVYLMYNGHNSNSRDNEPCCRCDSRQTNADRIRNMSDEELVEFITGLSKKCLAGIGECDCSAHKACNNCNVEVSKWLQSEAKVEESEEK